MRKILAFLFSLFLFFGTASVLSALTIEKVYDPLFLEDKMKSAESFEELFRQKKLDFILDDDNGFVTAEIVGLHANEMLRISGYEIPQPAFVEWVVTTGNSLGSSKDKWGRFEKIILEEFKYEYLLGYTKDGRIMRSVTVEVVLQDHFFDQKSQGYYINELLYNAFIKEHDKPVTITGTVNGVFAIFPEGEKKTLKNISRIRVEIEPSAINGIPVTDNAEPF
jgi:hypothetical protein